jgi:Cu/Ag efflux pump CusA
MSKGAGARPAERPEGWTGLSGQKIFDVVVRGAPEFSRDVEAIRNLTIERFQGAAVAIRDVAHVVPTPNLIAREAASRRIH